MWSAIFGAEQALQNGEHGEHHGDHGDGFAYPPSPHADHRHNGSPDSSPFKPRGVPVPVSPADTANSTPRSSAGDLSVAAHYAPPPQRTSFTRRPSLLEHADSDDDESPMTMLLRRMNMLMVRAGEHEFEKRVLVDQMEKDREHMKKRVTELEQTVQDLKDQNVQLQYKIEYNSEPMLMERLQDVTDMHDALTAIKEQLQRELEEKEKLLQELREQLAKHDETNESLQWELEDEKTQREQQRVDADASLAKLQTKLDSATQVAQDAAQQHYDVQLQELNDQLTATAQERDLAALQRDEAAQRVEQLTTSLMETQHQVEEVNQTKLQEIMELAAELQQVQQANEQGLAAVEQTHQQALANQHEASEQKLAELQQWSEQHLAEKDQQIQQLRNEWTEQGDAADTRMRERFVELESQLENQAQEYDARINEMNQVMDDYKHDCMELWKLNEDLKQQLALASADSMLKEAEFRQKEFSAQSRVSELESQVEEVQEAINRKEQELVAKEEELISVREDAAQQVAAASKRREEEHQPWKENAIRMLTDQVATAQRSLSDAMDMNLHLNNRNTWLEEQNGQLTESAAAATVQAAGAGQLAQRVRELECELEQRVRDIECELEQQRVAVYTKQLSILGLEAQIVATLAELDDKKQTATFEKQQLEEMLESSSQEAAALDARLAEWQAAHGELSTRLESAQYEAATATMQSEELHSQLEQWSREGEELRHHNDQLQQQVANAEAEWSTLQADTEARIGHVSHELDDARRELAAALEEVNTLKVTASASASALLEVSTSTAEVVQLRTANETLEIELQSLRAMAQILQEKEQVIVDLHATLKSLHEEIDTLKMVNAEQESQIKNLQEASAVSNVASPAQEEELEELRTANWELEEQMESLKSELADALKRVHVLASQAGQSASSADEIRALEADKEVLQEDLDLAQSTLAEAEARLQDLESTTAELSSKIVTLEQQNKNLQEASEESLNDLESKLEQTTEELEHLQEELHAKSDVCMQLERSLHEAHTSANGETHAFHEELAASRDSISKLSAEVEYLKSNEAALEARVQEMDQSGSSLSEELEIVRTERKALEHQLAQMQHDTEEASEQMEQQLTAARREVTESQASIRDLSDEIEQLKELLEHARVQIQDLEQQAQGAATELVAPLQRQVDALTAKNQSVIAELETMREDLETKDEQSKSQLEQLRALLEETKQENVTLTEAFAVKELEFETLREANATEITTLRAALVRIKDKKKQIMPELKQLRIDVEQLREAQVSAAAERDALLAQVDTHLEEIARLQTLLQQAEDEVANSSSGQVTEEQLRALHEEKNKVVNELRELEMVNSHLAETNTGLEATLQKSKEFCEDLSRRCDEKVNAVQDSMQQALEERAAESAQMAIMNGELRHEIEQLAESRFEQERYIEELRLHLADLEAEKNVLAARSHRLTEELSQFMELPDEDALAASQTQAPDLWELLSSGMEQLKADLELASKYASSIEGGVVLDEYDSPEGDQALALPATPPVAAAAVSRS